MISPSNANENDNESAQSEQNNSTSMNIDYAHGTVPKQVQIQLTNLDQI